MTIDCLYGEIDKNNFYIGRITQVYRDNSVAQVENLSLLFHRKIFLESLVPNTINYFVVIDSVNGIFLGEVYQNKINSNDNLHKSINYGKTESISPEINIDIIGIMTHHDKKFRFPDFRTVGVSEKVYLANKKIVQIYLESMEINDVKENKLKAFANYLEINELEACFKPSTLFDHHLLAVGSTNSGKSTSALSILDKILNEKKKALIIDPTGEYEDSFLDTEVKKLRLGLDTAISTGNVTMHQWTMLFETNNNTQGPVLSEAIRSLRYQNANSKSGCLIKQGKTISLIQNELSTLTKNDTDFDVSLLAEQINEEAVVEMSNSAIYKRDSFKVNSYSYLIQKVYYQLCNTCFLNFFNNDSKMNNLLEEIDSFITTPKTSLYINSSKLGSSDGIGGMIIDLICNYLMEKQIDNPFIFFIDEVHRYTKSQYSGEEYNSGLTHIAREGRKKGIFLFLTTQNPQDVSPILLGQVGSLLIHRLTHNDEIKAIRNYLDDYYLYQVKKLNQGEAILTSINLMKNIFLKVIKCNRKQYNDTPLL